MPAIDHEGAVLVDATLGLGGHTEAVLARCAPVRVIGIDRDTRALEMAGERLAPFGDRFTGVHAVYDEIPDVLDRLGLDRGRRRPVRPRRVLDAARRRGARLRLLGRRPARHADGRYDGPDRRRRPQHLLRRRAHPGAARLRRGEVRPQDRRGGRASPRGHAVHHLGRPRRAAVRRDPGPCATDRRAPGQAHLPGPAHGGQRRARRAAPRDAGRHRRHRGRRPGRRRELPLARGPPGQAGLHRRHPQHGAGGPAVRPRGQRAGRCGWSPAEPSRPTRPRPPPTRGPPRCGCGPSNACVRAHPVPPGPAEEPPDEQHVPPAPVATAPLRARSRSSGPASRWCRGCAPGRPASPSSRW